MGPLYDKIGPLVVEFYLAVEPLGHSVTYRDCHRPMRREIRLFANQVGLAEEGWVTGALYKLRQDERVAQSRKKHAAELGGTPPEAGSGIGGFPAEEPPMVNVNGRS